MVRSNKKSERQTGSKPGETFKFFKNTYRMYMIAEATDPKLIKNYRYRQKKLGMKGSKNVPHITMMHIHINSDNPDHLHLVNKAGRTNHLFQKLIEKKYNQISNEIYLKSSNTFYDIMGDFFAKVYVHDGDRKQITDFRMVLYRYLEMYLGKFTKREKVDIDGRVFFVYSYNGRELIAVPEYYHGIGVWTPHLSIIKLTHLRKYNPQLCEEFEEDEYDPDTLINTMKGVKGSMSYLNLGMHFNKIGISVKKV